MDNTPILAEEAARIWAYDRDTGVFVWRVKPSQGVNAGDVAGSVHRHGYVVLRYRRRFFRAHMVAWLLETGEWPERLDHKNLDRSDNRISNLRKATRSQNAANSLRKSPPRSGLKGAYAHKKTGKFQSSITVNGRAKYLGLFETAEAAQKAYQKAASSAFGEFARVS